MCTCDLVFILCSVVITKGMALSLLAFPSGLGSTVLKKEKFGSVDKKLLLSKCEDLSLNPRERS